MNCANHPETANVAFCRTCGKPLCANCTRDVRAVIYCENCLAERMQGQPPVGAFEQAVKNNVYQRIEKDLGPKVPTPVGTGPNPALAGILAGIFPVGVGAVYNGQYAKGLAHLGIFVLLVMGFGDSRPWYINTALGIGLGFFVIYQIIDAVRSAHAIQMGQPAPDPFGLGQTFSPGTKVDSSRIPTAAVVLIGLGLLFLLQTAGVFEFGFDRVWPVFLIGLGVWLFAKRQGMLGPGFDRRGRSCGTRGLVGPAVLITIGSLKLIESLDGPSWNRTWPVLLLVIGLAKLLETHGLPGAGGTPPGPDVTGAASGASSGGSAEVPPAPVPPSEVKNG
jgi:hypothetical protein